MFSLKSERVVRRSKCDRVLALKMIVTLVILAALAGLLYYYFTRSFQYWKKLGVPGPKPTVLVGNFPSVLTQRRNLVYEVDDIFREYKAKGLQYVGVYNFNTPQILALDGDSAKEVMVRNFNHFHDNEAADFIDKETDPLFGRNPFMLVGEEWKEKRGEITPAFTSNRIKAMKPLIDDVSQRMVDFIKSETDKNPTDGLDTKELCAKYTTDVVSSCVFAVDARSFSDSENDAIIRKMGKNIMAFSTKIFIYFILVTVFPIIKKFYKMPFVGDNVEAFFTNLMKDAIKIREENKVDRLDYLDHLIQLKNKKNISELDMAAHGITFFVDGFETSSNVMAFIFYALAGHPECQTRLRDEINANLEANGTITFENVNEMPYLEQVLCEALRLYPPVGLLSKKCTSPLHLTGDKGTTFKIDVGTCAIIPITSIHWDPANYPEPMKFDPDRFSPENGGAKAYEDAGTFLGFGLGPRICLGKRFAKAQVKCGVAEVIRNFEISLNSKTREPIYYDPKEFILQNVGGLWLNYKKI